MSPDDLQLLPHPKSVHLTGGEYHLPESLFHALSGFWPDAPLAVIHAPLPEGAYRLEISPESLTLQTAGEAGRRNAPFSPEAAGYRAFGSAAGGRYLERAGDCESPLRSAKLPTLWADMHTPVFSLSESESPGAEHIYLQTSQRIDDFANTIPPDLPATERRELACMANLARIAVERAILRRQGRLAQLKRLGTELERALPEFQALWHLRSRPGGEQSATDKYMAIANELKWIY